jgi:branched-chain amino acid transport system ATP-binding protein
MATKKIGEVILDVKNISLAFGGVKALSDISFNVREHEVRAIIGPNGAGKSSMLNCINGVYTPQQGSISFKGQTFSHMDSHQVATMGIARTFQNLALFKGMSVIDNIMSGRNLRIKSNILMQALRIGPAEREEVRHREFVEHIIDFLEIQAYRKTPVGQLPYGLQKRVDLGRALAMEPQVLLLGRKTRHVSFCTRHQRRVRHNHRVDRARHGRGDGYFRPRGGARLRQKNW